MNLVIIGLGKVGETLIQNFVQEKHDIIVIDTDAKKVENAVNKYDVFGIVGSGLETSSLNDANVSTADFLIASTSRDEVNILCCVLAKKLGAKRTVARVRDPEYFKEVEGMKEILGLDYAFNPELHTAIEIAQILKFPSAKMVQRFGTNKGATLAEFEVVIDSQLIGKALKEIGSTFNSKVLIAVVERGNECLIPNGDFVLEMGDKLAVIASENELTAFCKNAKLFKRRSKSAFIIGGGKIAYYLSLELQKAGVEVKIVESDERRAEELSETLSKATVILGDGTDQELLEEESLKNSDACIVLTGMDEENVIVSLYAKEKGVQKVITKIDRTSIINMVEMLGLDTVVSPKDIIANHIISFVRAHQADTGNGINTFYKLYDKVEALEFIVADSFPRLNVQLRDINLKKNVLIGGIIRGEEFILPNGATTFEIGDRVIVVSAVKQINDLTQILR